MADDPVEWVLETIVSQWPTGSTAFPADVERINRDQSYNLDRDERSRSVDLQRTNTIGASFVDEFTEPKGVEYHQDVEVTVGVRIEGLHASEYGQVETTSEFNSLVSGTKKALLEERVSPSIDPAGDRTFLILELQNNSPESGQFRDHYRHDYEVLFRGYEYL